MFRVVARFLRNINGGLDLAAAEGHVEAVGYLDGVLPPPGAAAAAAAAVPGSMSGQSVTARRMSVASSWGRLVCTGSKEPTNNRILEFTDTVISIGRKASCTLAYEGNMTISSCHCKITLQYGDSGIQARLEDTSSNGTYVNGQFLGKNKSCQLSQNDEVRLLSNDHMNDHYGDFVYTFQDRTFELTESMIDQLFPEREKPPCPSAHNLRNVNLLVTEVRRPPAQAVVNMIVCVPCAGEPRSSSRQ